MSLCSNNNTTQVTIGTVVSTEIDIYRREFRGRELIDPELIDKLVLSICESCEISYPHFKFHHLINELITNAIDHGVLCLDSHMKDSIVGFEYYLIERAKRFGELSSGRVSLSVEWVGASLLRIVVQDSGIGFDADSYRDYTDLSGGYCLPKSHGRGLAIVRNLCKSVEHIGCGNCTVVEFDISAA